MVTFPASLTEDRNFQPAPAPRRKFSSRVRAAPPPPTPIRSTVSAIIQKTILNVSQILYKTNINQAFWIARIVTPQKSPTTLQNSLFPASAMNRFIPETAKPLKNQWKINIFASRDFDRDRNFRKTLQNHCFRLRQ